MASTLSASSKLLGTYLISSHVPSGTSASVANGTKNSPSTIIQMIQKKEEDQSIAKTTPSDCMIVKSASEPKLSSFGMIRLFSRTEITLENTLLPDEKLSTPPSLQDGLDMETERDLRFLGSELIQKASILLKLPQVAAATGQIIYQRFYFAKSFVRYDFEITAMACINLASKIEEAPRRVRDVMNVLHHMRQLIRNRQSVKAEKITPLVLDKEYVRVKNEIIKAERRILKELGFCVHVKHPHKLIYAYLQALRSLEKDLIQRSWNYMNDSLRTDVFLRYTPETIACSCIFLAARDLGVPLPESPPWWEAFDADRTSIENISRILIMLYKRKMPTWKQLESRWMEARKRLLEKQAGSKSTIENTPVPQSVEPSNEKKSPQSTWAHQSRRGSPRGSRHESKYSPRQRKRPTTGRSGSPRRARSKSRSRSRTRSRSPHGLPKRYADYRRHPRALPHAYDNRSQRNSRKYESKKPTDRKKRS